MSEGDFGWLDRILRDLSEFAAELLTPGLAPAATATRTRERTSAPLDSVLHAVDAFAKYVPQALLDAVICDPQSAFEIEQSPTPMYALPSMRPADCVVRDGRRLPRFWLRDSSVAVLPTAHLRWLAGLATYLRQQLDIEASRLAKQIEHARFARAGSSSYALADMQSLDGMQAKMRQAGLRLQRCADAITMQAGSRLAPSNVLPNPFPAGIAWKKLRVMRDMFSRPGPRFNRWLSESLRPPAAVADIPYLYQR